MDKEIVIGANDAKKALQGKHVRIKYGPQTLVVISEQQLEELKFAPYRKHLDELEQTGGEAALDDELKKVQLTKGERRNLVKRCRAPLSWSRETGNPFKP